MNRLKARALVHAMAAVVGANVQYPENPNFISYVKAENDLKAKPKKPVNGYQAKQRKRKKKRLTLWTLHQLT